MTVNTGMPTERPRQPSLPEGETEALCMTSMLDRGMVALRWAASCKVDSAQVLTQGLPVHQKTWAQSPGNQFQQCRASKAGPMMVLAQAPWLSLPLFTSLRSYVRHKRTVRGLGRVGAMSFGVPVGIWISKWEEGLPPWGRHHSLWSFSHLLSIPTSHIF